MSIKTKKTTSNLKPKHVLDISHILERAETSIKAKSVEPTSKSTDNSNQENPMNYEFYRSYMDHQSRLIKLWDFKPKPTNKTFLGVPLEKLGDVYDHQVLGHLKGHSPMKMQINPISVLCAKLDISPGKYFTHKQEKALRGLKADMAEVLLNQHYFSHFNKAMSGEFNISGYCFNSPKDQNNFLNEAGVHAPHRTHERLTTDSLPTLKNWSKRNSRIAANNAEIMGVGLKDEAEFDVLFKDGTSKRLPKPRWCYQPELEEHIDTPEKPGMGYDGFIVVSKSYGNTSSLVL